MKIETKFNAGDTIWIKEFNPEAKKFMPESWQIDHINIKISKDGNVETRYYLGWWQGFWEDQIYATEEECQSACDQKNDEIYQRKKQVEYYKSHAFIMTFITVFIFRQDYNTYINKNKGSRRQSPAREKK